MTNGAGAITAAGGMVVVGATVDGSGVTGAVVVVEVAVVDGATVGGGTTPVLGGTDDVDVWDGVEPPNSIGSRGRSRDGSMATTTP